jgi:hypothetical protein
MDFSKYKNIYQFYKETGMTPSQAYDFLLAECKRKGLI